MAASVHAIPADLVRIVIRPACAFQILRPVSSIINQCTNRLLPNHWFSFALVDPVVSARRLDRREARVNCARTDLFLSLPP
jgi:hypothetical protein